MKKDVVKLLADFVQILNHNKGIPPSQSKKINFDSTFRNTPR